MFAAQTSYKNRLRKSYSLFVVKQSGKHLLFKGTEDSKEPPLLDISGHPGSNTHLLSKHSLPQSMFLAIYLQNVLENNALEITPTTHTHSFELPPSGDTVIDFVNELGYPESVEIVSVKGERLLAVTNPDNQFYNVVGIVTQYNIDPCRVIWKNSQGIQTFFSTQRKPLSQDDDDSPPTPHPIDLDLAKKLSLEAHQEKGEEEGNDADLERAIKPSLDPAFLPQGRAPVGGVTMRDPMSEATPKLHEVVGKGKAVVTEEQVAHSLIDMSVSLNLLSRTRKLGHSTMELRSLIS
ncbi:hypothetical protein Tco_0640655 [Tanacetum coccineum]